MSFVREHAFNSRWYGEPAGFLDDPSFFALSAERRAEELRPYSWAEFRFPLSSGPDPRILGSAGFFQVDTQLAFRINLRKVGAPACLEGLTIHPAVSGPGSASPIPMEPFEHERFLRLPDVGPEKLANRYALWCEEIRARSPDWCLELRRDERVQGWFFSEPDAGGLHLALAARAVGAIVSGLHLYQLAMFEYGRRGARIGHARFSVCNSPVHRIYSHLGASFLDPLGCWFWRKESS